MNDLQAEMLFKGNEVVILMQQGVTLANAYRRDQAINRLPHSA
jgi:hypothetical protein